MTPPGSTAIVVGYERLGQVAYISSLFRRYGYERVIAFVNRPELWKQDSDGAEIKGVPNIQSGEALAEAVLSEVGREEVPFLCIQDRVTLAYLDARERLYGEHRKFHVPHLGIRRARVKPSARICWKQAGIDATRWTVLAEETTRATAFTKIGGLGAEAKGRFIVKPISGTASELVTPADSWDEVQAAASLIRQQNESAAISSAAREIVIDDYRYDLVRDVLVEERMTGVEYTLDGFAHSADVSVVSQHKETMHSDAFFTGDGGIYSPPDADLRHLDVDAPLRFGGAPTVTQSAFAEFMYKTIAAIGLWNWSFHGEVMVLGDEIRNIELNPRSPGGLLWKTAALHLGLDPIEYIVRAHLGIPNLQAKRHWVTAQFPVFADKKGVIARVEGVEAARDVPYVSEVFVAKTPGDRIESLRRENYAAFVCIHAPTHAAARRAEAEVRGILRVVYQS